MSTSALVVALALAALLPLLVHLGFLALRLQLRAEAFAEHILKLVREDRADTALKLCRAIPDHPLSWGTTAMIQSLREGRTDPRQLGRVFEAAVGERAGARDPRLQGTGRVEGPGEADDWGLRAATRRLRFLSVIGLLLLGSAGGVLLATSPPLPRFGYWVLGSSALLALHNLIKPAALRRRFGAARDRLARELARPAAPGQR